MTREVIGIARGGDLRTLRVTMLGQPGVLHDRPGTVIPRLDEDGQLDIDSLAAQVGAIAMDEDSESGSYAGGDFVSGDIAFMVPGPVDDF